MRALSSLLLASLVACMAGSPPSGPADREHGSCVIGGCSSELCSDQMLVSPCIWRDEFACYRTAQCERQPGGTCGWTATPELTSCLAAHTE